MASLYFNEILAVEAFAPGRRIAIDGPEARHAAQVARVRTGERIGIGDGRGRIGWGRVVHVANDGVAIEVDDVDVDTPDRPALWLVQALAKGDRDELAVQAATELGAAGIVPWQAARSVSRWAGPKAVKGAERWQTITKQAAKQAIRGSVPEVAELVSTTALAARAAEPGVLAIVLEPTAPDSLAEVTAAADIAGLERIELIVGPEGGIDPLELRELELGGARLARLGRSVLRTSTAGPAALAALGVLLARW